MDAHSFDNLDTKFKVKQLSISVFNYHNMPKWSRSDGLEEGYMALGVAWNDFAVDKWVARLVLTSTIIGLLISVSKLLMRACFWWFKARSWSLITLFLERSSFFFTKHCENQCSSKITCEYIENRTAFGPIALTTKKQSFSRQIRVFPHFLILEVH